MGGELDTVEASQRVAHRGVAALADVVDDLADRHAERRVEDVREPAGAEGDALGLCHRRPEHAPHHRRDRHLHRPERIGRQPAATARRAVAPTARLGQTGGTAEFTLEP